MAKGLESLVAIAFGKIGTTNGTKCPEFVAPKGNNDPKRYVRLHELVYEYFIAQLLSSHAEKRKDAAKKACEAEGMFNEAKNVEAGTSRMLHDTPDMNMLCVKKNPASRIDATLLKNELNIMLGADKAEKLLAKVTKLNAPATSYEIVWKDG